RVPVDQTLRPDRVRVERSDHDAIAARRAGRVCAEQRMRVVVLAAPEPLELIGIAREHGVVDADRAWMMGIVHHVLSKQSSTSACGATLMPLPFGTRCVG